MASESISCNQAIANDAAKSARAADSHSLSGTLWFGGWLFTVGFAHLVWWKAIIAVVLWPYFLGTSLH